MMRRPLSAENPFFIAVLFVVCLSPVVAYSLPDRVTTLCPWCKSFSDFVANLIPSIDKLANRSLFPEITRFFLSLEWAIWGPICFWFTMRFGQPSEERTISTLKGMRARWWYVLFIPPFALATLWFLVFFPLPEIGLGDTPLDQLIRWTGESRFWLGLTGSVFVSMAALCVMWLVRSYSLIRLAYRVRALVRL